MTGEIRIPMRVDQVFTTDPGSEPYSNACINWLPDMKAWSLCAMGYKLAADTLMNSSINLIGIDALVYPIVFLYRHHLELELKHLLFLSKVLLDEDSAVLKEHNLLRLWQKVRPKIEALWPEDRDRYLNGFEEWITEFSDIDPESFSFRYSINKEGESSLPAHIRYVNLLRLKESVDAVSYYLSCCIEGVLAHLSAKADMLADSEP